MIHCRLLFLPRDAVLTRYMLSRRVSACLSVCPSVRPSVTSRHCIETNIDESSCFLAWRLPSIYPCFVRKFCTLRNKGISPWNIVSNSEL